MPTWSKHCTVGDGRTHTASRTLPEYCRGPLTFVPDPLIITPQVFAAGSPFDGGARRAGGAEGGYWLYEKRGRQGARGGRDGKETGGARTPVYCMYISNNNRANHGSIFCIFSALHFFLFFFGGGRGVGGGYFSYFYVSTKRHICVFLFLDCFWLFFSFFSF